MKERKEKMRGRADAEREMRGVRRVKHESEGRKR